MWPIVRFAYVLARIEWFLGQLILLRTCMYLIVDPIIYPKKKKVVDPIMEMIFRSINSLQRPI